MEIVFFWDDKINDFNYVNADDWPNHLVYLQYRPMLVRVRDEDGKYPRSRDKAKYIRKM
jgi:hypothetical protein